MSENEQERRETLGDIVSAMHNDAELYHGAWLNDPNENPEADGVSTLLAHYARRIEAAWKRQEKTYLDQIRDAVNMWGHEKYIAEHAQKPTIGNAAAIREALKGLDEEMTFCERNVELGIGLALGGLREHCRIVRQILNAALSAPARNCDVMSRSICTKHFSAIYEGNRDGLCDVQTEREKNIHLYYIEFHKWLLAPAAERKGESDGK